MGIDAAFGKSPGRIQALVDAAPPAENYATDGWWGYVDVVYPGRHVRNVHNKNATYTVEGVNAGLRHYIPVLGVFADAYNAFGEARMNFRKNRAPSSRELPFSILDRL